MKRHMFKYLPISIEVAPRRGAWVETTKVLNHPVSVAVAPRRGAWVET